MTSPAHICLLRAAGMSNILKGTSLCGGQKSSPPTLVTYPNKAETLIADDRLYVWVGYKGGRATFLAGGYPPYTVPSDINRKFHIGHLLYP